MGESERKSLRDDCIEKGNRQLLSEWDDKKNEGLTPEDVSAGIVPEMDEGTPVCLVAMQERPFMAGERSAPVAGQRLPGLRRQNCCSRQ